MKIHQIPMGARFVYEGEEYVKSGPMVATGKTGQRLIPKYAALTPIGDLPVAPAPKATEPLQRDTVLQAFDTFCTRGSCLVPADKRSEFDAGREEFLRSISA